MRHWLAHQIEAWRWGAGVMVMLALPLLGAAFLGGWAMAALSLALSWEVTAGLWALCAVPFLPIFLPSFARHLARMARTNPPPSPYGAELRHLKTERKG